MHRKTQWQRTIISCYHFYVMMMSMAVSVHASVTDWILTDGLINLSSTNKDQPFEFHNRRTFPIFLSRSKLIFRNILHPNAPKAKGYIFFSFLGARPKSGKFHLLTKLSQRSLIPTRSQLI